MATLFFRADSAGINPSGAATLWSWVGGRGGKGFSSCLVRIQKREPCRGEASMATPCADTREFSRARGGGIGGQASMEAERGEAKDVEVFVFWTLWGRSSYAVVSFRLSFPTFPFSLAPGTHT